MTMHAHHQTALEALQRRFAPDPSMLAVILVGSVARGTASERSDMDLLFVVTDDERDRRQASGELLIDASDLGGWPRAHIGGHVIDRRYLASVAQRGPEPARYAFTSARVLVSRDPSIDSIVPTIAVYQEHERLEKMRSFVSQLPVHLSYLQLGVWSKNSWLAAQTATELVFFGGRLMLAHNRILYANRKQFISQLETAPEKPSTIVEEGQALMRAPTIEGAHRFHDLAMGFREWPTAPEGPWSRYTRDREVNWLVGPAALADS